jgi:Carboxypeptidase regulatory-like domain
MKRNQRRALVLAGRCVVKSLPARTRAAPLKSHWLVLILKDHQSAAPLQWRRQMKPCPLTLFSILPILLLIAVCQSSAQVPQRDNRPRAASISGRVTIAGKPAANAVITVVETDLKPDAGESGLRIPLQARTRTDGDGRYLVGGLAEGRYFVSAMLKAFVAAAGFGDHNLSRTVTLDEGEAREKIDFALIRGGVMTGKVMDDEGAPLIARRVQLYTVDEQGQKGHYQSPFAYEMSETDDRGVYRIYGLPPGRYIISAGGEGVGDPIRGGGGKFALTYHPDTIDEKQARVIEIKEGSEVTDIDIRFGSARKTYEAAGRVVDRETGKPVPRIEVSCWSKFEVGVSNTVFSTTAIADLQGAFKISGLPPGRYHMVAMDSLGETGYTSDAAEFEITNDNVSGVEVKVFLGASVSGIVVIEGADAAAGKQLQSLTVYPSVSPPIDAAGDANARSSGPQYFKPGRVNADGSFTINGLHAGGVSFSLSVFDDELRIKRIERDGVEVKDAIEVRPGERVSGVRIVAHRAQGRIRGQVRFAGGALPAGWRLSASASRPTSADESTSGARTPASAEGTGGYAIVDEKGRFVIEGLPAGEYDLFISITKRLTNGSRQAFSPPGSNRRVTVGNDVETSVTLTIDISHINQPNNRPNNQEDRR